MEAVLEEQADWDGAEKHVVPPRIDASFTEVYELIFHNKTMVRSELDVLLQLLEKKLMEKKVRNINRN